MFRFGFFFLLGFSCLFLCEGAVFSPSNRTNLTFIPGSTEKLVWSFTDAVTDFSTRTWVFTPSDGRPKVGLVKLDGKSDVPKLTTAYEVTVEKPATLVLKNVNLTYDGTYEFALSPGGSSSEVVVYIAVKPNATATCSSPIILNEGDNVSCTCRGQGGNPPADVTWYKDNHKSGGTGKEEKILTLTNVTNEKDHGSYKCVAQSHPNEMFQDEVNVEVIVNSKPTKTKIEVPEEAYLGEKLVINCSSKGYPTPNFTITHNFTSNIVSNHSSYIKDKVDYSDAGLYECFAKNLFGNNTDSDDLIVKEKRPSTTSATKKTTTQSTKSRQSTPSKTTDKASSNDTSCGTEWYVVVVTLVAGIIIGILFSYGVSYSRRKFVSRKPQSCPEPRTCEVDSTYQELDVTKMNTEDNYQSLAVDAAINNVANEDDSNYTALSKTRDVENNYQSLALT